MTQPNSIDPDPTQSADLEPNDALCLPTDPAFDDADDNTPSATLNAKQQQALEWLMSGGTITEAAELVGVKRQTVSRWVHHHDAFSQQYEQWQEQVRTGAEARLMGLADAAIDNLMTAIRESRDVKASQFVLKLLGIASHKRE